MTAKVTLLLLSISLSLSACVLQDGELIADPFESTNRKIFQFNMGLFSSNATPSKKSNHSFKRRLGNFLDNLYQPINVIHDLLQGDIDYAVADASRFLINSTFGVLGLYDFASVDGIPKHHQSVSRTLYTWGIKETPYLMLPFLGPSTFSEIFNLGDTAAQIALMNQANLVKPWIAAKSIHQLSTLTDVGDSLEQIKTAQDPYVVVRSYYALQFHRNMKKTTFQEDQERLKNRRRPPKP